MTIVEHSISVFGQITLSNLTRRIGKAELQIHDFDEPHYIHMCAQPCPRSPRSNTTIRYWHEYPAGRLWGLTMKVFDLVFRLCLSANACNIVNICVLCLFYWLLRSSRSMLPLDTTTTTMRALIRHQKVAAEYCLIKSWIAIYNLGKTPALSRLRFHPTNILLFSDIEIEDSTRAVLLCSII